jgi:predicted nucleic acid-binding protein
MPSKRSSTPISTPCVERPHEDRQQYRANHRAREADRLDLLQSLFGEVIISPAVERELLAKSGAEAERIDAARQSFLRVVVTSHDTSRAGDLTEPLGRGEAEAVTLALALGASLLIDDQAGRTVARLLGVPVVGVVGMLLEAKSRGAITEVGPLLRMIRDQGYWLSDALIATALKRAGE